MDTIADLIRSIARVGENYTSYPHLNEVEPFTHFFDANGNIDYSKIDTRDGACTRREILSRFLLLCAVIDQGPDMTGVRDILVGVVNSLYRKEIRFLHKPLNFFKDIGIAIDDILKKHKTIKEVRSSIWGQQNKTNPSRYNLFIDNSKQVLNYAVFRWGVPLSLPLLLERDCKEEEKKQSVLIDYLESWNSSEKMCTQIKGNERYGLGKAIGDKACHLFAKWMVSSFGLTRVNDPSWGNFSYEVPYDSNAGRVLWRTGYLLKWASIKDYIGKKVIQQGKGKQGHDYIRVTNIRGMSSEIPLSNRIMERYVDISLNHLRTHKRQPTKIEIQRIQHAYLLEDYQETKLSVADFDEGLMHVGTNYCFNHAEPSCKICPINRFCEGYITNGKLVDIYRT